MVDGRDYPSIDFSISDDGVLRRAVHLPTGMTIETTQVAGDPIAVSRVYRIVAEGDIARPQEIAQAALRHLRVWLIRKYGKR